MSLTEGLNQSAAYIAADMEAMLRECDVRIASHDEHSDRLEATIAQLRSELEQVLAEKRQAEADRQEAEQVLEAFRAAAERGAGLRQSRGAGPARLWVVSPNDGPSPATATRPAPAPQTLTPPVRISGGRTLAVLEILSREPDREWTPKAVAMELEAGASGSIDRARALLVNLCNRGVVTKTVAPDSKQTFYRLIAAWEAA